MSFWETVVQTNLYQQATKPAEQINAYAAMYPLYEQQTPQYPQPNPYTLAATGYRANELVYACIQKLIGAIHEAPLLVYDNSGDTPDILPNHPLRALLENPCEGVTEQAFWDISEVSLDSAGFAAWEKERNRMGAVIHLWPMRPDWCSFYRGDGRPIRAVRYQPYGLPPVDIPRENVVLFQYFDPLYPLLKGLSPMLPVLKSILVDNAASAFLQKFFESGSVIAGLLSSDQSINEPTANMLRERWRLTHGGIENWGDIAVLGNGTKYQQLNMSFREMAFQEIDGRDEARICAALKVPPILVGAKVGLNASTYSNYVQARKAFYEETIVSKWSFYQGEIKSQLLPEFEDTQTKIYLAFDTKNVKALQDNKDAQWKRGTEAAKQNIITRDEARQEMGLDPIDKAPVFVGVTVRAMDTGGVGIGVGGSTETSAAQIVGEQPQDITANQENINQESDATKNAPGQGFVSDDQRRSFFGLYGHSGEGGSGSSRVPSGKVSSGKTRQIMNNKYNTAEVVNNALDSAREAEAAGKLPTDKAKSALETEKKFRGRRDYTDEDVLNRAVETHIMQHMERATGANLTGQIGNGKWDLSSAEGIHNSLNSYLERRIQGQHARYTQKYGRRSTDIIDNVYLDGNFQELNEQSQDQATSGQVGEDVLKSARDMERKQFHQFAAKRKKEGHPEKIKEFKFKHITAAEAAALLTVIPAHTWRKYP